MIQNFRISSGIEHVAIPLLLTNVTNSSTVCLKIEQDGDKYMGSGSWFIDDLLITRSREQNDFFFESFEALKPSNWYRLVGGQLKVSAAIIQNFIEL